MGGDVAQRCQRERCALNNILRDVVDRICSIPYLFMAQRTYVRFGVDIVSEELYTKTDLTAAVQIGIQAALASMHLDNSTAVDETHVCQGDHDMANKKIRRPIQFNGCKVWICADNEQDYANQIIALYQTSGKATEEKDTPTLRDFAKEWYDLHAPNIGIATRKSYQQQLDPFPNPFRQPMAFELN